MKNRKSIRAASLVLVTVGSLIASTAFGQTIGDLMALVQKNRVVIHNNASIDDANPDVIAFTTSIAGQLVELNLKAARLNDSFVTAINYYQPTPIRSDDCTQRVDGIENSKASTQITFGQLQIVLDGCDITSALLAQCNVNQCWDTNPTIAQTSWTGTFGTHINLNLSVLNPQSIAGCAAAVGQTSFFDLAHPNHQLKFAETQVGQGKGGSLNYQVIVYHMPF